MVDTNVIVSALLWKGKPLEVLKLAIEKEFEVFTSPEILREVGKVLTYPHLPFLSEEAKEIFSILLKSFTIVHPKKRLNVVKEDPNDNMFLECAVEVKADYLITGDKHLLKLKKFKDTKILNSKEFLKF